MSWLYLPAAAGGCSPASGSKAGELSAMSSGNPTPSRCLKRESETGYLTTRQSGVTFVVSRSETTSPDGLSAHSAPSGKTLSLRAASPANHSRQQASNLEPTIHETCGLTPFAWLQKSDQRQSTWRMCQRSFPGLMDISDRYSATWPTSGMMHAGWCYLLPTLGRHISESDSGLWPTPRAEERDAPRQRQGGPSLSEFVLFPTPVARDASGAGSNKSPSPNAKVRLTLGGMAAKNRWPTPTVNGNNNRVGLTEKSGDGLATAVKRFSTSNKRGIDGGSHSRAALKEHGTFVAYAGGALNPDWVE